MKKQISLNPVAETFTSHSASKAISGGRYAVRYSSPYSTADTEVGVSSSCENLGATPKGGNISSNLLEIECNTVDNLEERITGLSNLEKRYHDIMGQKINASNINCYDSDIIKARIQVNSNLVQESKELELTYNRGDTLVYNTNNSNSCLIKHFALKCQVSASCTDQNMVASLDLSTLDSSSDRFTANSETCDTVAHESHNYLYSSLSYFSDISDHNSQVARINEYQKTQTNEFQDCNIEI